MKKNKTDFLYPIITTIACIFLCSIVWGSIKFSYSNPNEIIGEYSTYNYSVYNDTTRYIIFILIPVATFFLVFFFTNKKNNSFNFNLKKILLPDRKVNVQYLSLKNFIFILFIAFILFLIDEWDVYYLDIFEEGLSLSGATNFQLNGKPWENIYINTGLFFDVLNAKIAWLITGYTSIGAYKFYIKFLNLLTNIAIIYFLFELSKQLPRKKVRSVFFIFISATVLYITSKNYNLFRDLPLILFLISILGFLNTKKTFYILLISILSIFSIFWSLDRGFFLNLTLFSFLIYIFVAYKKEFYKTLFFIFIFWVIGIQLIGTNNFINFISHTKEILTQHEYLNGLIHPQPFTKDPNATRATKSLILIIINFIITILIVSNKKKYFLNNTKFLFIPFSILNFLMYKIALSRSDGPHIQNASYFTIILFVFFLVYFVFYFLDKKKIFIKKNITISYILIFFLLSTVFVNKLKSVKNIYAFPKNINNLIIADDKEFINHEYIDLIAELNLLIKDSSCFQAFSYEQAMCYLLKK